MTTKVLTALLALLPCALCAASLAAEETPVEAPEEIVVVGRERVIAESQEYIGRPHIEASTSPLLWKACHGNRNKPASSSRCGTWRILSTDGTARIAQAWLDAVDAALATNASTFAVLDINELLNPDGYLSKLRAKGYDVREP